MYSFHKTSKLMMLSHLHAVVPYGRSASIMSIELLSISFINSKQSPFFNL
nr:MAG TPA: hypothetical protein [Caudoviricetes sp.]